MKKLTKSIFIVSVSIILILSFVFTGCNQTPKESEPTAPSVTASPEIPSTQTPAAVPPPSSAPTKPMQAKLTVSEPPLIGKPVRLTATFAIGEWFKKADAPDTKVELILPEGFELVSGDSKSAMDVMRGTPAMFQTTVKSVKKGSWKIEVRARYYLTNGDGPLIANAYLYTVISEDNAEVSETVPISPRRWDIPGKPGETMEPTLPPIKNPVPGDVDTGKSSSALPLGGEAKSSSLTIRGSIICPISENALPQNPTPSSVGWVQPTISNYIQTYGQVYIR